MCFKSYDNSHRLKGALCAIAECQKFYPDLVKTSKPWVQSLDQTYGIKNFARKFFAKHFPSKID